MPSTTSTLTLTPLADLLGCQGMPPTLEKLPNCISILKHLSCIQISGNDGELFLQGQFSNDLSTISEYQSQITGYCNPKGRILALFRLLKANDGYYLLLPTSLTDSMLKRLTLYKMRAKVEIRLRDDLAILGLINNPDSSSITAGGVWSVDSHRQLLIQKLEENPEIVDHSTQYSDEQIWMLTDIISGHPQIYQSTTEEFIPQQVNLDLIDGVSFTKGCYPGQEIIARIRYLGKLKQRMIAASVVTSDDIQPGTPIFITERPGQKSGTVVDAIKIRETWYLTAMVPANKIESGELYLFESAGQLLQRLSLPYEITTEKP